jgi:hypothetical protein
MKILILCAKPDTLTNNGQINNLSTIYAFHFLKWLSLYKENEITIAEFYMDVNQANSLAEHDFCILTVNRGAIAMKPPIFEIVRKKIKHNIITICGSNKFVGKEDVLLFMMGKQKKNTLRVFWGADTDLLKPIKSSTKINILVDHQYYGKITSSLFKKDRTVELINSLKAYQKINPNIIVKHIGNGIVHDVTDDYKIDNFKQSTSMDFREIYKYYNEAHIYVVTHPEALGVTTIECGCAGAMVVQPQGFIKNEIISNLYHYSIDNLDSIDWNEIIQKINIEKSIKMAQCFLYKNAIIKLYSHMLTVEAKAKVVA